MSMGAIVMLIAGLLLVWGGLAASIAWAVHVHRRKSGAEESDSPSAS